MFKYIKLLCLLFPSCLGFINQPSQNNINNDVVMVEKHKQNKLNNVDSLQVGVTYQFIDNVYYNIGSSYSQIYENVDILFNGMRVYAL